MTNYIRSEDYWFYIVKNILKLSLLLTPLNGQMLLIKAFKKSIFRIRLTDYLLVKQKKTILTDGFWYSKKVFY